MARKHGVAWQGWEPLPASEAIRPPSAGLPSAEAVAWVSARATALLTTGASLAGYRGNRLERAYQRAWTEWRARPEATPAEVVACASE